MALIAAVGFFLLSVFAAALSRLLAEEFGAWTPSIIRSLIKIAVARLPEMKRERFTEEWQSHVNDVPGRIGKLLVAVGFLKAAHKIAWRDARDEALEAFVRTIAKVDEVIDATTKFVNVCDDQYLASLQGASDEARVLVNSVTSSKETVRSTLVQVKELRDKLAVRVAAKSSAPQSMLSDLFAVLSYRLQMRDLCVKIDERLNDVLKRTNDGVAVIAENKNSLKQVPPAQNAGHAIEK